MNFIKLTSTSTKKEFWLNCQCITTLNDTETGVEILYTVGDAAIRWHVKGTSKAILEAIHRYED